MVGAVVVDPDGIYDPAIVNDRLLLGLKGTMSEFELNLLRQRSLEAIRQKAGRGELQFLLPVGLCWTGAGKIEKDRHGSVDRGVAPWRSHQPRLYRRRQRWLLVASGWPGRQAGTVPGQCRSPHHV